MNQIYARLLNWCVPDVMLKWIGTSVFLLFHLNALSRRCNLSVHVGAAREAIAPQWGRLAPLWGISSVLSGNHNEYDEVCNTQWRLYSYLNSHPDRLLEFAVSGDRVFIQKPKVFQLLFNKDLKCFNFCHENPKCSKFFSNKKPAFFKSCKNQNFQISLQ